MPGPEINQLCHKISGGDRLALSRAITLVESTQQQHQKQALDLLKVCQEKAIQSKRIAISGSPGVGKSTFIESLGLMLVNRGLKVAVLAIDPSSHDSGGSILGDKTRMPSLSKHPLAFVRPSPNAGKYGGIGHATFDAVALCEVAGYEVIFIETVGIGQSEIEARHTSDLFALLLQPGSGDELQGIKRGIMEVADLLIINKHDGRLAESASTLKQHIQPIWREKHPDIPVMSCSSVNQTGIEQIWTQMELLLERMPLVDNRLTAKLFWYRQRVQSSLTSVLEQHYGKSIQANEDEILKGNMHYLEAVEQVVDEMKKDLDV